MLTDEEKKKRLNEDPEDRKLEFVPRSYPAMRLIPGWNPLGRERLERCLDLYLCPRQRKMKVNVDPEDLIPKLPKPKDLMPFPTVQAIVSQWKLFFEWRSCFIHFSDLQRSHWYCSLYICPPGWTIYRFRCVFAFGSCEIPSVLLFV
jgi:hypothetical protein